MNALSRSFLDILNRHGKIQFTDSTDGNHTVDSARNEEHDIQVFFPNSRVDNPDEELYNTFRVQHEWEEDTYKEFRFLKDVIDYINTQLI